MSPTRARPFAPLPPLSHSFSLSLSLSRLSLSLSLHAHRLVNSICPNIVTCVGAINDSCVCNNFQVFCVTEC